MPHHSAQLALFGFEEDQIAEAAWMAQVTAGLSVYLYGIDYNVAKFKEDLAKQIDYVKSKAQS